MEPLLRYDNRTGRGPGPLVRAAGRVWSGVREVYGQVAPYADHWAAHNRAVLGDADSRQGLWVVLGDSLGQGVGASAPTRGWVSQVADEMRAAGHDLRVLNLSATGARVDDVLDQQVPLLEHLPVAPRLITVLAGTNDLVGGRHHRRALPERMRTLVQRLPRGTVAGTLPQPRGPARDANRHLDDAAAAGRLHLVDFRTAGPDSWRGMTAADRFHPNDLGYAALARMFAPVLQRVLDATGLGDLQPAEG